MREYLRDKMRSGHDFLVSEERLDRRHASEKRNVLQ